MKNANRLVRLAAALLVSASPLGMAWSQEAPQTGEAPAAAPLNIDTRPSSELTPEELRARIAQARAAMAGDLPDKDRREMRRIIKQDEAALKRASRKDQQPEEQGQAQEAAPVPSPDAQAPEAPAQQPAHIDRSFQRFLSADADIKKMKEGELRKRFEQARRYLRDPDVPEDARQQLENIMREARAELEARRSAAAQPQEAPAAPENQPQPTAPSQPDAPPARSAELDQFLAESVDLGQLSDDALQQRFETARKLIRSGNLSKADERQVRQAMADARTEIQKRRRKAATTPQEEAPAQPKVPEVPAMDQQQASRPQPAPSAPAIPLPQDPLAQQADKLIADSRSAADLNDDALRRRIMQARELLSNPQLGEEYRGPLNALVVSGRQELASRAAKAGGGSSAQPLPPVADEVNDRAERRAREFLADDARAEDLRDGQLRRRLEMARDLLSEGGLSRETEGALRQRLGGDRAVLRSRVAEADARDTTDEGDLGGIFRGREPSRVPGRLDEAELNRILADRRRPRELSPAELNLRISAYRDIINDERYGPEERMRYRESFRDASDELRLRYEQDRQRRAERLRRGDVNIGINLDLGAQASAGEDQGYDEDVWAAEADDSEIERQLVARPFRPLPPQYRVPREALMRDPYAVMSRPEVRRSLPAVEIDTLHFGFNEANIREEELANLDKIGRIMERIVAAHPQEVFVIEGHTDAVGSDAYNLMLSRQRAESVRQALMQYYVISPQNLSVVGLGERYLKIPTPDPEQENRRVTVRRVTPLVSGYRPQGGGQGGQEDYEDEAQ